MKETTAKQRAFRVALTVLAAAVLLGAYFLFWHLTGLGIPCVFHLLTGLLCPGCGITRAIFSLLQFDVSAAFSYNPMAFVILAYLGWYGIAGALRYIRGKKDPWDLRPYWIHVVFLVLFVGFGILRNL